MYPAFEALLQGALDRAVASGALAIVDRPVCRLEPPAHPIFGDATSRVAMIIARRLGRPAADVARTVASHVVDPDGWLARVEAAGPGFVNVEASLDFWRAALAARLAGVSDAPTHGRALVVLAASPTGPSGIRAAAVGDALARLLAAAGHEVERGVAATHDVAASATAVRTGSVDPAERPAPARTVVVHDVAERDAARRAKAAVAAAGGRPGHVTAVPVAPLVLRRRGRVVDAAEATALLAQPAARFALVETPAAEPAVLDVDRLAGDRIDDPWTRIRYAAARIARVGAPRTRETAPLDALDEPERECLRAVGSAPDVVTLAARRLEPEAIAAHARALTAAFHRYYNRGGFLDGAPRVLDARRALARGVGLVLDDAVAILGAAGPGVG
jgi:arginyl-tRNA synthetase